MKNEPPVLTSEWESEPKIKPRPAVEWFAAQMEARLQENDDKSGWLGSHFTIRDAIRRVRQELRELEWEISYNNPRSPYYHANRPRALIFHEAADAANFLLMVADRARRGLK